MSYWSRAYPGTAEALADVRQFTAAVLGEKPGVDLAVLAIAELAGNAILHTASGEAGGQFVIHVADFPDRWQVRVDDSGSPSFPRVCESSADSDHVDLLDSFDIPQTGRGLALIAEISQRWGVLGDEYSRAVWAEIPHPRPEPASAQAEPPVAA